MLCNEDSKKLFDQGMDMFIEYKCQEKALKDLKMEDHVRRLINHTCKGGKYLRGNMAFSVGKVFCLHYKKNYTEVGLMFLGIAIELLESAFLVGDDLVDQGITRRGKNAWYLEKDVGFRALNDSYELESHAFEALSLSQSNHCYFLHMFLLFKEVIKITVYGQIIDGKSSFQRKRDANLSFFSSSSRSVLSSFSLEEYKKICKYKTSYYTFFLPLACGILYSLPPEEVTTPKFQYFFNTKKSNGSLVSLSSSFCSASSSSYSSSPFSLLPSLFLDLENISILLGIFFQAQDDYLDVFGDPCVMGKQGTDIQDGKLTICLALALTNKNLLETEKAWNVIKEHYNINEVEHVDAVKNLYKEMNIQCKVFNFIDNLEKEILGLVNTYSQKYPCFPTDTILASLEMLKNRKK